MSTTRTPTSPGITVSFEPIRPPAWALLEQPLIHRRTVRAHYHGMERWLCPHALGWKLGRAKVLVYQANRATGAGTLSAEPRQRWRSMFVDEIEDPTVTNDPWLSADNYTQHSTGIDRLIIAIA